MQILIVEDDERLATLIKRGLEEHGYTTVVAYDGQMGLRLSAQSSSSFWAACAARWLWH